MKNPPDLIPGLPETKKPRAKVKPKTREQKRTHWKARTEPQEILDYWSQLFELRRAPRLTDARLDKIIDAFDAGISFEDICRALAGHSCNQWRRDTGGRTIELEVLLRPQNIEEGLRKFDGETCDMRQDHAALLPLRVQWPDIRGWVDLCHRHVLSPLVPPEHRQRAHQLEMEYIVGSTLQPRRLEIRGLLLPVLAWQFDGRNPQAWANGWPELDLLRIPPAVDDFLCRVAQADAAATIQEAQPCPSAN